MAATFALGSPRAMQPYPVETELVRLMADSPQGARIGSMFLGPYQGERHTAEAQYGQEVAAQNDFARQQLEAQIANNKMTNAASIIGHPGGYEFLMGSPSLRGQVAPDIDPGVLSDLASGQRNKQLAETMNQALVGAYHGVQAGFPPSQSGLSSIIPQAQVGTATPLQMQIEGMKEGAASQRAALARGDPGVTFHQDFGKDDQGRSLGGYSEKVQDRTGGVQGAAQRAENARRVSQQVVAGGDQSQRYGGQGSSTGSSAPAGTIPPKSVPPEIQAKANNYLDALSRSRDPADRAKYKDIVAAMPGGGGNVAVYQRPDKSYGVRGAQGQY